MTKPKHPTAKSIRQGQQIYLVYKRDGLFPTVMTVSIGSTKTKIPPLGEIIKIMPVNLARTKLIKYGNDFIFYSRKRAHTAARELS